MPGNGSKTPAADPKTRFKLSGGSTQTKTDVNPVSAKGEISSPHDAHYPSFTTDQSPTRNSTNLPKHPDITQHPLYRAVQKLHPDLQTFLEHDWETNSKHKHTKLKYYNILRHFNPETSLLPTDKKEELKKAFRDDLLPKLSAFCSPPPPSDEEMDTDDPTVDYHPLHRKTTIAMLKSIIAKKDRRVNISPVALKDEVLALYKHYINPTLELPQKDKFSKRPRAVQKTMVTRLSINELRHAIQAYHPELFLNVPVLRLAHYISIYRLYVSEEPLAEDAEPIVLGYHYWVIKDLVKSKNYNLWLS
ncbi:uncharacterized protein MELLADRAFT_87207 [Melampsora larici-populina 98AG31]|uniref:Uncharacterized protein n=1 Tax=Melampsora larici-populina (strain 98AG31 / pathotype 3-4-7) TaxID=747676 RepID=F4R4X1_MELLP|nr:uncharacterized protein MELLADRAFT_87207 [Melampsora larici-populina 98AG31]EGG12922.1 hypothetical protein MELLADRAFT_87207 [Melampsora larici-populina 98AG31]